ncbi:MAG: hypothetical protein HC848_03005 [Limnobacter sp.]|nr:hypothetical protein [Limnobacter sp.]
MEKFIEATFKSIAVAVAGPSHKRLGFKEFFDVKNPKEGTGAERMAS